MRVPEMEALDAPDTNSSCEQRSVSTTGPQALTFLNGDFAREQASYFAERLVDEAGSDTGRQISRAFQLALGRPAGPAEVTAARDFLAKEERQITMDSAGARDAGKKALAAFCAVLLNTNEFFYMN
jgi:hypothetical protein